MTCILCAARGRTTQTDGHCCTKCRTRLDQSLGDILRLAAEAAAYIPPTSAGTSRPTFGSRPPMSLDGLDPELQLVQLLPGDPSSSVTILDCLESWERVIREDRGFMPYGPASALRAQQHGASTAVTLTGVVGFLRGQLDWATTDPSFGLEDFSAHIRACVRALGRYGMEDQPSSTVALCPTLTEAGECRYRLRYIDLHEQITCPRCKATRDATQLANIAMHSRDGIWLDAEAAATYLRISVRTLRRWHANGRIQRSRGRYRVSALTEETMSATII